MKLKNSDEIIQIRQGEFAKFGTFEHKMKALFQYFEEIKWNENFVNLFEALVALDKLARDVDSKFDEEKSTTIDAVLLRDSVLVILSPLKNLSDFERLKSEVFIEIERAIFNNSIDRHKVYQVGDVESPNTSTLCYILPIVNRILPSSFTTKMPHQFLNRYFRLIQVLDDLVDVREDIVRDIATPISVSGKVVISDVLPDVAFFDRTYYNHLCSYISNEGDFVIDSLIALMPQNEGLISLKKKWAAYEKHMEDLKICSTSGVLCITPKQLELIIPPILSYAN